MTPVSPFSCFPSAKQDAEASTRCIATRQTMSPSYRLAYADTDFLTRDELRPVRLQLELMKPELIQQELGVDATVVVFGGTRVPDEETARQRLDKAEHEVKRQPLNPMTSREVERARRIMAKSHYYEEARKLAQLLCKTVHARSGCKLVVITGGGPGIMEAANRGAFESGEQTMGLNIILPHEQAPNPYITPELCFQFHYFSIRKMHFLMRAQALVAFPGGYGTLDELFETLTLIQTKKIKPVPVLLFGREFWSKLINFDFLLEEGVIAPEDLDIFRFVDTAEEALRIIADHFNATDG